MHFGHEKLVKRISSGVMMYDDAHADWGHRDNILGETHRAVNIGIAFNGKRTTFVQHFEGGEVEADKAAHSYAYRNIVFVASSKPQRRC